MYVISEQNFNGSVVHCLDLNSRIWTMMIPYGQSPNIPQGTTWIYSRNIYFFGDEDNIIAENAIFCYNVSKNTWERPEVGGVLPVRRKWSSIVVSDDTVFLFGGYTEDGGRLSDLHVLDMQSMCWKQVQYSTRLPNIFITLTRVSQSAAVLFGNTGYDKDECECWLLNLDHAKENLSQPIWVGPSAIWTKIPFTFQTYYQSAVLEPTSQRLWLIGGYNHQNHDITSDVLKMSLKLLPLKDLAMDSAARNISDNDRRLLPDSYPRALKNEIVEYRVKWI